MRCWARPGRQVCARSICHAARSSSLRRPTGATKSSISCCPIASATARRPARPLLDPRAIAAAARPAGFRFDAVGGRAAATAIRAARIAGVTSKLDYLADSGRQHALARSGLQAARPSRHLPRLRDPGLPRGRLRASARGRPGRRWSRPPTRRGMHVILDVVFNHSGNNWVYADGQRQPPFLPLPSSISAATGSTALAAWSSRSAADDDAGVWPSELQARRATTRAPARSASAAALRRSDHAEFRRTDFFGLRDFNFDGTAGAGRPRALLQVLDRAHRLRRLPPRHAQARARGDRPQLLRRDQGVRRRTSARPTSSWSAKSPAPTTTPSATATCSARISTRRSTSARSRRAAARRRQGAAAAGGLLSTSRASGTTTSARTATPARRHVSMLDDHDHVSGDKVRFSTDAASESPGRGRRRDPAVHASASRASTTAPSSRSPGPRRRRATSSCRTERRHRRGSLPARGDVRAAPPARRRPRRTRAGDRGTRRRPARLRAVRHGRRSTASTPARPPTCASPR